MRKSRQTERRKTMVQEAIFALAYFIVYRPTDISRRSVIFSKLHEVDLEQVVYSIIIDIRSSQKHGSIERTTHQLLQVSTIRRNVMVWDITRDSNHYCYEQSRESLSEDDEPLEKERGRDKGANYLRHNLTTPCWLLVVNKTTFWQRQRQRKKTSFWCVALPFSLLRQQEIALIAFLSQPLHHRLKSINDLWSATIKRSTADTSATD